MKKLLIVGSQTIHTYNYIALVKDNFDDVLLITDKKRGEYAYETVELDFSLSLLNMKATVRKIKKTIQQFNPSVIHIHQANSYAFYTLLAARRMGIPTILTIWGSDVLLNPKKNLILKKIAQFNLRTADYLTADASFMANEVKALVKPKNDILIANFGIGIDPQPIEKENIVYSNRLHKKLYRIDKIIAAFHPFSQKHPDWKLVIAATGDETDDLKKKVVDLQLADKVEFVGWIDKEENEAWYSKAKFWVSVPESDATAISLLEAMACGCIPIVSDLSANREWIKDGVNGVIVKDINSEFISTALTIDVAIAKDINHHLIEEKGTKSANKEKFIQLYKKALHE